MNDLIVGLVQQASTASREKTLAHTVAGIRDAAARGAQLVVLQELHAGPYFCQTEDTSVFDQAEPIPGPSSATFSALAKELGIVLVTSLFERRAPGLYHNTAVVFEADGRIAGQYRKMHIPDDPGYYEKFYFAPGDTGFMSVPTSKLAVGPLVCPGADSAHHGLRAAPALSGRQRLADGLVGATGQRAGGRFCHWSSVHHRA